MAKTECKDGQQLKFVKEKWYFIFDGYKCVMKHQKPSLLLSLDLST